MWIAVQSKDAMNALGIGTFLNTMYTGQVLTLHIVFLPLGQAVSDAGVAVPELAVISPELDYNSTQ